MRGPRRARGARRGRADVVGRAAVRLPDPLARRLPMVGRGRRRSTGPEPARPAPGGGRGGDVEALGAALTNDLEAPVVRAPSRDRRGARRAGRGRRARRGDERQRPTVVALARDREHAEELAATQPGAIVASGTARAHADAARPRMNGVPIRGGLTARRGPLEPTMEVRLLPPEPHDLSVGACGRYRRDVAVPEGPSHHGCLSSAHVNDHMYLVEHLRREVRGDAYGLAKDRAMRSGDIPDPHVDPLVAPGSSHTSHPLSTRVVTLVPLLENLTGKRAVPSPEWMAMSVGTLPSFCARSGTTTCRPLRT